MNKGGTSPPDDTGAHDRGGVSASTGKHDLTMKPNVELDRRKVLSTVGGLAVAGSGLAALTGSAAAQLDVDFTASQVEASTDDGDVSKLTLNMGGTGISWENFDNTVGRVYVKIQSRILSKDGNSALTGWTTAYEKDFTLDNPSQNGEFNTGQIGHVTLYGGDSGHSTAELDNPDDGTEQTRTVEVAIDVKLKHNVSGGGYELADPQDEAQFQDRATFWATSKNEEAVVNGGGDMTGGMS